MSQSYEFGSVDEDRIFACDLAISMKTPAASSWIPGLILGLSWWQLSMAQHGTNRVPVPVADLNLQIRPSEARPIDAVPALSVTSASSGVQSLAPPVQGAPITRRQPPRIRLSPWASEVVKLAESGIETDVILAYIENSGTFNLGAEQIVYMNDLGLPGEAINAMLQHDREVISGAKPLTITSEPEWRFSFDPPAAPEKASLEKPVPKPPTKPPTSSEAEASAPTISRLESSPEFVQPVAVTPSSSDPVSLGGSANLEHNAFGWQGNKRLKKRSPYPVREPYPVEITAPIVFIHAQGRVANTIVVLGFPRSSP